MTGPRPMRQSVREDGLEGVRDGMLVVALEDESRI